ELRMSVFLSLRARATLMRAPKGCISPAAFLCHLCSTGRGRPQRSLTLVSQTRGFVAHQRVGVVQGAFDERRGFSRIESRQRPQCMGADERLRVLLGAL